MSVAVEGEASTVKKDFFPFNLDVSRSAEDFDRLKSRTKSFNSFLEKEALQELPFYFLQHWRIFRH